MAIKTLTGEFCWNELITPDVAKAKDFYGKLLGWTYQEHDVGLMTYTMIKASDKDVGGMMSAPKEQNTPPTWMSYISVDNLEDTLSQAESLGGRVIMSATAVGDYGKFGIIQDPTGAHISFWKSLKDC